MEKQSKTFDGMVSNFEDSLTIMLRDIGSEFLPEMKAQLALMLAFWDENGKAITVSFVGMVKTI